MKKSIVILIICILSSCEGFLFQEEDDSYIVIDSQEEKIALLNGIYNRLTEVHGLNYLALLSRSDDLNMYTSYSFSYPGPTGVIGCNYNEDESFSYAEHTGEAYQKLYVAILNANNLIVQLDETVDALIVGEAYFLRAYCYLKLARLFGQVPLVTDIDVNYSLDKPTYREVYELIESDLLKALDLLPDTYSGARIPAETPHKGTAKALLAEVYLSMAGFPVNAGEKYAEAARLAGEVIGQADYYGYALLDDMGNLWKCGFRHNNENIFGLYFSGESEESSNYFGGNFISIYSDNQFKIEGNYNPEFRFFNDFPDNYRKIVSVVTGEYEIVEYDTLGGSEYSTRFRTYDPWYNACYFIEGALLLKWLDHESLTRHDIQWSDKRAVTLYLLRYAHTLLTYAEARARSEGPDASCYEAVNMIRRRANKLDIHTPSQFDLQEGLTTEQFLDSVVWERAWELFGEPDGRWFDIIRLDLRDEIAANRYTFDLPTEVPANMLNGDWYFYLIPATDRWLNPNFSEE